jgi:transcriptional regulator with XRE-family HTH domain
MLADLRHDAGLSQRQLARMTGFDHTVIAHSERGRPAAGEAFWKLADVTLGAGGMLAATYAQIRDREHRERQDARIRDQRAREQRAGFHFLPPPSAAPDCGPGALVTCPHCRREFELVPRATEPPVTTQ